MPEMTTPVDRMRRSSEGTLLGSRDLRDWQPYVLAGQAFVFLFMVVEFGAVIPPAIFSTAIALLGIAAVLISPPGLVMRTPVSIPIVLYLTWYVISRVWAFQPVWWMRIARREVPLTIAMVMVVSVLPLRAFIRTILASLYVVIGMTIFALVTRPGTAAQHVYPGNDQPPLPGWHGTFEHKTGMSLFLLIGLITLLVFERSQWRRIVVTAVVTVLIVGSQSSTGLSGLIFVLGFHVWLRHYRSSLKRRGSMYVLISSIVGVGAVLMMWAFLPVLVESRGKDLTFSGRTIIWSAALDAIADRPFLGYGVGGAFRELTMDPTAEMIRKIGFTAFHAHNSAIQLLLDLGVVGLVLFLFAYASTVLAAIRSMQHDWQVAFWGLLILGLQFVMSLSEVASWGPWVPLMGAIYALSVRAAHERERAPASEPVTPAVVPVLS